MIETDAIDDAIVDILRKNGRVSNKEIAERLRVSAGTVRNRIARMISSSYLKIEGGVDPDKDADHHLVYVGAKVAMGTDLRIAAEALMTMPYVRSVTIVTGRYDLLVEVFLPDHELISFISDHLSADGWVASTETFVAIASAGKWV
jgi:DNA-binding Lrp family transcriptional regulator